MKKRTAVALVLLGVALSVAVPVIADSLTGGKSAGAGNQFNKTNGPHLTTGQEFNFNNKNPWVTSNRLYFDTYGNFTSNGVTEVQVDQWNGTWTNTSNLDVSTANLTVNINDKQEVTIGGYADALRYTDMAVDDGAVDFEYVGSAGTTTLTVTDFPSSTTIGAIDDDTSELLDASTTDASGTATFALPNSDHDVTLERSNGGPIIDEAAASPQNNYELQDAKANLSVPISDPDLPEDKLDVTFYLDGSAVTTKTISSNTTVSTTVSGLDGGQHTWHVEVTDAYDQSATTQDFTFKVPSTLYIRDVSDNSLITASTTIRFYGSDQTVERTSTDGTVNLTNLAVHQPMLVTVESSDYYKRQIYLESIYQQSSIYLLNQTNSANSIRFTLDDKTGQFPSDESTLFITRSVSQDGTDSYQIVASSQFGVKGFTEQLQTGTRYRLVVEGPSGQQRILGAFTPTTDETVPLPIGRVNITGDVQGGVAFGATTVVSEGQPVLRYRYRDQATATSDLAVTVYNMTGGKTAIYSATNTDVSEMVTTTIPVGRTNAEYKVVYNATRSGAPDRDGVVYAGEVRDVAEDLGLDPTVQMLLSFALIIAMMGLVVITDSAVAAAMGVGTGGVLTMTGFLNLHPIQLGIAGVIALLYLVGTSGRT